MRVVLLGANHWHSPTYYQPAAAQGHEVILFDDEPGPAQRTAAKHGFALHADYADLDRVRPDFAVCLGRHDRMPRYVAMCIERRIPFLAEKPGGLSAEVVRGLARRCDEVGLFHAAAFVFRWDASSRAVKDLLDAGRAGRAARVALSYFTGPASRYVGWGSPWALQREFAGGGSLYNVGIHLLDVLRFWGFAPAVESALASHAINRHEVDDVVTVLLRMGQTYAVVESGYLVQNPYGGLHAVIFGEKANLELRGETLAVTDADGKREESTPRPREPRDVMLGELLDLSRRGQPSPVTLHDLAAALALCEQAQAMADG